MKVALLAAATALIVLALPPVFGQAYVSPVPTPDPAPPTEAPVGPPLPTPDPAIPNPDKPTPQATAVSPVEPAPDKPVATEGPSPVVSEVGTHHDKDDGNDTGAKQEGSSWLPEPWRWLALW